MTDDQTNPFPSPADSQKEVPGSSPFTNQLQAALDGSGGSGSGIEGPAPDGVAALKRTVSKPKRVEKRVRMALGPLDIDVRVFVKGPNQDQLATGLENAIAKIVKACFQ